jgi:hypothetical protein
MSVMSEIDAELKLDWRPTWFGYEHGWSDYYIVEDIDSFGHTLGFILESKAWPHPILTGELATLVHFVSVNEGITWSRHTVDDQAEDVGRFRAGLAAIGIGLALWLVAIGIVLLVLR